MDSVCVGVEWPCINLNNHFWMYQHCSEMNEMKKVSVWAGVESLCMNSKLPYLKVLIAKFNESINGHKDPKSDWIYQRHNTRQIRYASTAVLFYELKC